MGRVVRMMGRSQGAVLGSLRTVFGVGTIGGMTDGQLLEQFLARRDEAVAEAAFAALVAFHGPMVWDVCRRPRRCKSRAPPMK